MNYVVIQVEGWGAVGDTARGFAKVIDECIWCVCVGVYMMKNGVDKIRIINAGVTEKIFK